MISMGMMQMAVVQIVDMSVVHNRRVAAVFAMNVIVMFVLLAIFGHFKSLCMCLGSVRQDIVEKLDHMIVIELVVHVSTLAFSANESSTMKSRKSLGHRRHADIEFRSQLGNTMPSLHQRF